MFLVWCICDENTKKNKSMSICNSYGIAMGLLISYINNEIYVCEFLVRFKIGLYLQ